MKKIISLGIFICVLTLGTFTQHAQALTSSDAEAIILAASLTGTQATYVRGLVQPVLIVTQGVMNQISFKKGSTYQFDWNAPKEFYRVDITLKNADTGEATLLKSGVDVTSDPVQHFSFVVPTTVANGTYYINIAPPQSVGQKWTTSRFSIVQ